MLVIAAIARLCIGRQAMYTKTADFVGKVGVVGCHRPPLTAGEVLRGVKTVARGIAQLPGTDAVALAFEAVGAIFNNGQLVLVGQLPDGAHIHHRSI